MPMDYARARANMVTNQLRPNRVEAPDVLDAMAAVPRERFLPKALRGVAYTDEDLPLPDGHWLIEPLVLARLIQAAEVQKSDVVLVVGCATGYAAAVLARLAATVILLAPSAAAATVEALLDDLGVDNVVVAANDDPAAGHPSQAPFDVIVVVGSVPEVPPRSAGADRRGRPHRGGGRPRPDRQGHGADQAAWRGRPARGVRRADPAVPRARFEPRLHLLGPSAADETVRRLAAAAAMTGEQCRSRRTEARGRGCEARFKCPKKLSRRAKSVYGEAS